MELEPPIEHCWDDQGNSIWYDEPYPDDVTELLLKETFDDEEDILLEYDDNDEDLVENYEQ